MRRADLLYLAGMTAPSFNSLAARSLLPFPPARSREGWANYLDGDALRLALLRALTQAGQPQSRAAELVRGHFDQLVDYADISQSEAVVPFMLGMAILQPRPKAEGGEVDVLPIITEAGHLDEALKAKLLAEGRQVNEVRDLCFVNVTACMRSVLERAGSYSNQMARLGRLLRARR